MMRGIVIVGAGGHAKVCIEILQAMGQRVAVCVGSADSEPRCVDVPVLQGDDHLARLHADGHRRAFVALGSNQARERLMRLVDRLGFDLVNAVSPASVVSPSARLGRGVAVMPGAVINAEAVIGDGSIVNTGATVDHDCRIGKCVHIAPQSALAGNVHVGDHAFLGIGSKVIPGIRIGDGATIGAGGVVISDVAPGVVAVGVPATALNNLSRIDQ